MPEVADLDTLAAMPEHWEFVADLLLSEQVPVDRVYALMIEHPPFAAWFTERVQ